MTTRFCDRSLKRRYKYQHLLAWNSLTSSYAQKGAQRLKRRAVRKWKLNILKKLWKTDAKKVHVFPEKSSCRGDQRRTNIREHKPSAQHAPSIRYGYVVETWQGYSPSSYEHSNIKKVELTTAVFQKFIWLNFSNQSSVNIWKKSKLRKW